MHKQARLRRHLMEHVAVEQLVSGDVLVSGPYGLLCAIAAVQDFEWFGQKYFLADASPTPRAWNRSGRRVSYCTKRREEVHSILLGQTGVVLAV